MRTLEPLSQNDPQWKDIKLGLSSTVTLGQAGCFVSSFAILAYYFGHPTSPVEMNQLLINANLFSSQDLISSDDDLAKLFSDIQYLETNHYENAPADLNLLKDLVADPKKCVIVEIDLGNGQVHFTPVADCDGTSVTIQNVWDGKVKDLKSIYGDPAIKILKYVVYEGTPASNPAPDNIIEIKQGDFLKLMQKSEELDKIGAGMSFTQIEVDTLGFSSKVLQKYQEAQNSAANIPAPESAPVSNSAPDQPITNKQFALLQSFLSLIGLKLESK